MSQELMDQDTKRNVGIAGAVMATMAAAGAAYLYLGKDAPKRRKKVAAWMKTAEREIVTEAKKLKDAAFTEENYDRIIEMVTDKYRQVRNITPDDISDFVQMMRDSWERAGEIAKKSSIAKSITRAERATPARKTTKSRSRTRKPA